MEELGALGNSHAADMKSLHAKLASGHDTLDKKISEGLTQVVAEHEGKLGEHKNTHKKNIEELEQKLRQKWS